MHAHIKESDLSFYHRFFFSTLQMMFFYGNKMGTFLHIGWPITNVFVPLKTKPSGQVL